MNKGKRVLSSMTKFLRISKRNLAYAIIAIVMICGLYLGFSWLKNRPHPVSAYKFSYSKMVTVKLPSDKAGSGITFDKPEETKTLGALAKNASNAIFVHQLTVGSQSMIIAEISADSVNTGATIPDDQLKNLTANLSSTYATSYKTNAKVLQDYATQRIAPIYNFNFGSVTTLVTDNIKSNAWIMDFTTTVKEQKYKTANPELSGKVIMAAGKSSYYFFMIGMLPENRDLNPDIFYKIINSIKIDQ